MNQYRFTTSHSSVKSIFYCNSLFPEKKMSRTIREDKGTLKGQSESSHNQGSVAYILMSTLIHPSSFLEKSPPAVIPFDSFSYTVCSQYITCKDTLVICQPFLPASLCAPYFLGLWHLFLSPWQRF